MIPTVLQALINKYNEVGEFVNVGRKIYWFNGKRFEYWCNMLFGFNYMVKYKNQLYTYNKCYIMKYIKNQFDFATGLNHLLLFPICHLNNCIYYLQDMQTLWVYANLKYKIITTKPSLSGMHIFGFQNCIYIVSFFKNEKYDLSKSKWSNFASTPPRKYNDVQFVFIIDKLYALNGKSVLGYYDCHTDKWI